MKISLLKKYNLFSFIFVTLFALSSILSSCGASKRSDCPTYRDSDPKVIFGEITLEERMEQQEKDLQVKSDRQRRKEAKKQIKRSKKTRKRRKK
ncbi:MAG: hypothetical protein COZ18_03665 [Flexibacter sp. CG_4_10_14_3_um_filter_32_15]|nr:MAG: hypothetical protein COZ18_03665 [Flexibacter sp. CG_4_10_14_3_um_filter_32_15]